jgi:hypothetical protein
MTDEIERRIETICAERGAVLDYLETLPASVWGDRLAEIADQVLDIQNETLDLLRRYQDALRVDPAKRHHPVPRQVRRRQRSAPSNAPPSPHPQAAAGPDAAGPAVPRCLLPHNGYATHRPRFG